MAETMAGPVSFRLPLDIVPGGCHVVGGIGDRHREIPLSPRRQVVDGADWRGHPGGNGWPRRPILIDYANYAANENGGGTGEMVQVDKTTLKKLVMQNYLLKQMVNRGNDAALKQLLEELELVLLELSNAEADGKKPDRLQTIRSVKTILNQNDVLFKMKVYDTDKDKRKTVAL